MTLGNVMEELLDWDLVQCLLSVRVFYCQLALHRNLQDK